MANQQDEIMRQVRRVLLNNGVPEAQFGRNGWCTVSGFTLTRGAGSLVHIVWTNRADLHTALPPARRIVLARQWAGLLDGQPGLNAAVTECCVTVRKSS